MQRLVCALVILAACGDDGTGMGAANLTYVVPSIQSAYSKPFKGADGNGTEVLGWKIEMTGSPVGTGCKKDGIKVDSSVGIFTSQAATSTTAVADLATGDISITLNAPPVAPPNGAAANMGATGVNGVEGTVTISGVGKSADGKTVLRLMGMINAGGSDGNGNPVVLMGSFDAPVCN